MICCNITLTTGDDLTVLWNIIPTCDDAMSSYTLVAFCIFAIICGGLGAGAYWWTSREFQRLTDGICEHDNYIEDTSKVINDIQVELAVQHSSMKDIKADIAEMKSDIKADIASLRVDIKTLLMRK